MKPAFTYHYCVVRFEGPGASYLDGTFEPTAPVHGEDLPMVRAKIAENWPGAIADPCNFTILSLTRL